MSCKLLITIDGPAGAGKSTVSRRLAEDLGYRYVDTGALYRAVALAALEAGVSPEEDERLGALIESLSVQFVIVNSDTRLLLNGRDITGRIRTPEVSMMASAVSARPVVRAWLLSIQRGMGREKAAVFEGRDMGTVVFPDADVKFFLDASAQVRALRRYEELKGPGKQSLTQVEEDMARRDRNDSTRDIAPLRAAMDSIRIDSSNLSITEVIEIMKRAVARRTARGQRKASQETL